MTFSVWSCSIKPELGLILYDGSTLCSNATKSLVPMLSCAVPTPSLASEPTATTGVAPDARIAVRMPLADCCRCQS